MTGLRVFFVRLAAMLGFGRRSDDLAGEMELHLEMLAEEYRRQGLSGEEARAAASRAFGGVMPIRDDYRAQQQLPSVDALMQDVRLAARRLLRDRTSTLVAIGLLTLGVTSAVIMGNMLDRLLVRPPHGVDAPDRVARVYDQTEDGKPSAMVTNYATMERLSSGLRNEVECMAVYMTERLGFGRGPEARRLVAVAHSEAYFDVLGLTPAIGVLPTSRHAEPADVAVISYGLWQRQFGADNNVLGRTLHLGQRLYTIVAVAPRGFRGIDVDPVDVWLPLESRAADGRVLPQDWRTDSTSYFMFTVIARLPPGYRADRRRSTRVGSFQCRSVAGMVRWQAAHLPDSVRRAPRRACAGGYRSGPDCSLDRRHVRARVADCLRQRGQPPARTGSPPQHGARAEVLSRRNPRTPGS